MVQMEKTTMPVSVKTAEKPNYESEIIQIICKRCYE